MSIKPLFLFSLGILLAAAVGFALVWRGSAPSEAPASPGELPRVGEREPGSPGPATASGRGTPSPFASGPAFGEDSEAAFEPQVPAAIGAPIFEFVRRSPLLAPVLPLLPQPPMLPVPTPPVPPPPSARPPQSSPLAVSTEGALLTPGPADGSAPLTDQEIFNLLYPDFYIDALKAAQDFLITQGEIKPGEAFAFTKEQDLRAFDDIMWRYLIENRIVDSSALEAQAKGILFTYGASYDHKLSEALVVKGIRDGTVPRPTGGLKISTEEAEREFRELLKKQGYDVEELLKSGSGVFIDLDRSGFYTPLPGRRLVLSRHLSSYWDFITDSFSINVAHAADCFCVCLRLPLCYREGAPGALGSNFTTPCCVTFGCCGVPGCKNICDDRPFIWDIETNKCGCGGSGTLSSPASSDSSTLASNEGGEFSALDDTIADASFVSDQSLPESLATLKIDDNLGIQAEGSFTPAETQGFKDAVSDARASLGGQYNDYPVEILDNRTYQDLSQQHLETAVDRSGNRIFSADAAQKHAADPGFIAFVAEDPSGARIYVNGDRLSQLPPGGIPDAVVDLSPSGVIQHEIGHAAGINTGAALTEEWADISTGGNVYGSTGVGQFGGPVQNSVSKYGGLHIQEDFAETFVAYHQSRGDPTKLTADPVKIDALQKRFDYLERSGVVKKPEPPPGG